LICILFTFETLAFHSPSAPRYHCAMSDEQIHAKAVIAAAIIQSRGVDIEGLASVNKDLSNRKLAHLQDLTERIYNALAAGTR